MRYVLHMDFFGSEELILFAAFWLYFIGSVLATRDDSHISADMTDFFVKNIKIKRALYVYKYALSLIITLVGVVWAWNYIVWSASMNARSPAFKFPMLIAQSPILFSFILSAIYLLKHLVRAVLTLKTGDGL